MPGIWDRAAKARGHPGVWGRDVAAHCPPALLPRLPLTIKPWMSSKACCLTGMVAACSWLNRDAPAWCQAVK